MQKDETLNNPGKALFFDGWYKGEEAKLVDFENFDKTAKLHVE